MRLISMLVLVAWVGSAGTARADVTLTFWRGHVTLKASNATVSEILDEWAKVGQTRIVNAETLTGTLADIDLTDVTETQALDVILSSVAGFIVMSHPTEMADRSQFDRIVILPASTPSQTAASTDPLPMPEDTAHSESTPYREYKEYPASPPDSDTESVELATPNPTGVLESDFPAYSQFLPVSPGVSPPTRTHVPAGAPVPGMPVNPAPQNTPAYRTYPIQDLQTEGTK